MHPDDLFPDIPHEFVPLLIEMVAKHGGERDAFTDPEELFKKEPKLVKKMIEILREKIQ